MSDTVVRLCGNTEDGKKWNINIKHLIVRWVDIKLPCQTIKTHCYYIQLVTRLQQPTSHYFAHSNSYHAGGRFVFAQHSQSYKAGNKQVQCQGCCSPWYTELPAEVFLWWSGARKKTPERGPNLLKATIIPKQGKEETALRNKCNQKARLLIDHISVTHNWKIEETIPFVLSAVPLGKPSFLGAICC